MKCLSYFLGKIRKNISWSSAEFAHGMLSVNKLLNLLDDKERVLQTDKELEQNLDKKSFLISPKYNLSGGYGLKLW